MSASRPASGDPFADPRSHNELPKSLGFEANSTLAVGRDATLTLGTDSLIVLDTEYKKGGSRACFGFFSRVSKNTRSIPFYNILWAETDGNNITINYALSLKRNVRPATLSYSTKGYPLELVNGWVEKLLDRAYGESKKRKRAKIFVNPKSGKGKAVKLFHQEIEPLFIAAKGKFDVTTTNYRGEATDVSEKLDIEAYDIIVGCSGDGLPYEIFNGLGKRPDAKRALGKIAVVHVPCGSGNAMSSNLNGNDLSPSMAALAIIKGVATQMDLMSITQGNRRTLSFLSQGFGIIADADLGTENLRWMGPIRFDYGCLVRILNKSTYPCDIAIKYAIEDKSSIKEHYRAEVAKIAQAGERTGDQNVDLEDNASTSSDDNAEGLPPLRYGTVNDKLPDDWELISYDNLGTFYCGNMAYAAANTNLFSSALPNDGYMDLLTVDGDLDRSKLLAIFLSVGNNTKFFDLPEVKYSKVLGFRLTPKQEDDGYISIDGERIPFEPFQVEVHRGLGTVLSKTGRIYEAKGPL